MFIVTFGNPHPHTESDILCNVDHLSFEYVWEKHVLHVGKSLSSTDPISHLAGNYTHSL